MKMTAGASRFAAASVAMAALWSAAPAAASSSSSPSTAGSSLFRPLSANSSLFALHADGITGDQAETAANWRAFERFLLSDARATPVILLFTDWSSPVGDLEGCSSDRDEREWGEAALFPTEVTEEDADEACIERVQRHQLVVESAAAAAKTRSTPWDPIVVVPRDKLPQAFHYHRVESVPSMLWLPPRSARGFQRFPSAGDNFLDLSTSTTQLSARKFQSVDSLEAEVADFVFKSHVQGGYRSGKALATASVPRSEGGGPSLFHLVTALAIAVLVLLVISEHRDAVLFVVQTRGFWFFVSLGVVYISLSGVFYSIINRAALMHYSPQHGIVFVYPSSRRQFMLEGMLHGGWSFAVSLAALAIVEVVPRLRSTARDDLLRNTLLAIGVSYTIVYFTFLSKYRWMAIP